MSLTKNGLEQIPTNGLQKSQTTNIIRKYDRRTNRSAKEALHTGKMGEKSSSLWLFKLFYIPVFIAVALRVLPPLFYGNTRVYDKPIPYEIIDDFLSEDMIQGNFQHSYFISLVSNPKSCENSSSMNAVLQLQSKLQPVA